MVTAQGLVGLRPPRDQHLILSDLWHMVSLSRTTKIFHYMGWVKVLANFIRFLIQSYACEVLETRYFFKVLRPSHLLNASKACFHYTVMDTYCKILHFMTSCQFCSDVSTAASCLPARYCPWQFHRGTAWLMSLLIRQTESWRQRSTFLNAYWLQHEFF